jgi:Tol biopolymer transport system component/serine/threonine protein kinase
LSPERWRKVKDVVATCLELPSGDRAVYLDDSCAGDADLRSEVESLLASYDTADDVLERPLHPADDRNALAGRTAGEYRFVREIGEGGMSRVYLAERIDGAEPRQAAIKVVKRGMDYEFVLRRFRHERQIMGGLDHPNIARLYGGGSTDEGIPYFVIEYIPGLPIDRYCDEKRLGVRERVRLFRTVCSAVSYAHEQGVVHRDIKPGNILITDDGVPKLLDFGIAKVVDPSHWTHSFDMTASVLRLMTPEYASPEQVRGEYIFEPTDIYSLGVLLFELLTGHHPYRLSARTASELARAICEDEPGRPSSVVMHRQEVSRLPSGAPVLRTPEEVSASRATEPGRLRKTLSGDLDNILLMALRKEPQRRYASVREFSDDLRLYLEGRPVTACRDTAPYRTGKLIGRHRKAAIAAAIGIPLLCAVGYGVWRWRLPLGAAEEPAPRIRPLTTLPGNERQPVFSPDGRSVAYVWGGGDGRNADVYVRSLEGGEARRVTRDPAEDTSPAWSPDGARIAFLRAGERRTQVRIAPQTEGEETVVADVFPNRVEAVGRQLDWSPDGAWMAVADKASAGAPFAIWLVRVADGSKRQLTFPPDKTIGDGGPAFSPDGRSISFLRALSSGITELWAAPLKGGEARQVTFDSREVFSQTWSPDGAGLVFSSNRTGSTRLWRVSARGGSVRKLAGVGNAAADPAFSRDGRRLAFSQLFRDANIWRVATAPESAATRKLIASPLYDSSPQYSPDGRRIAFRSDRSGAHEIWVCDAEGRDARQLTHFGGPLTGTPRWSPDGRWIVFDSRPEGQADIYAVSAEGGVPRRLTSDASEDVVPSWSRDGRRIYFASNRSGSWQVWAMGPDGGGKRQLTQHGGFAGLESPDGRFVYYALSRSQAGLYRMPVVGGAEEAVLADLKAGMWGYWAPGADGVYFAEASALYRLDAGGRRLKVAAVEKALVPGDSALSLSPDGRWLLYTQLDQSGSDIMLADFAR